MSAFKKAYDDNGYIVRLHNSSDRAETVKIAITPFDMKQEVTFGKCEVKTFRIDTDREYFTETDLLERS